MGSRYGNCTISARESRVRIPALAINFSVLQMSKATPGPTQPPFRRPVCDGENSALFIPEFNTECTDSTVFLIHSLCGQDCLHALCDNLRVLGRYKLNSSWWFV